MSPAAVKMRIPGILNRLGLLNRIPLSPEGTSLAEAKQATRSMIRQGHRFFCLSYHSPSLVPGNTPYVQTRKDLDAFHYWMEEYFSFFFGEMGGMATTPADMLDMARALRPRSGTGAAR